MNFWMFVWGMTMWAGLALSIVGSTRGWRLVDRIGQAIILIGFAAVIVTAGVWLARNGG